MNRLRGSAGLCLAAFACATFVLAALAACLNPQPDDNPLVHGGGKAPVAGESSPANAVASDPSSVSPAGGDGMMDIAAPTPDSIPAQAPPAPSDNFGADAGAAGSPDAGDLGEGDAGMGR